jgi:putative FmdB family regulatory protein
MPIYEYRCSGCGKKTTVLLKSFSEKAEPSCGHCGGRTLKRLFSRFAAPKSEEARLERMADPSAWSGVDENDPKSVADFTRRMATEMGDEFKDAAGGDIGEMSDSPDGDDGPEGSGTAMDAESAAGDD